MKTTTKADTVLLEDEVCCPEFDPSLWDNKKHIWNNKLFIKETIPEIFHIPLPGTFGKAITRMSKKVTDAGAMPDVKESLLLTHDPSPFKSELLMAVTKEIPDEINIKLSGFYMSKVFDGPYSKVPTYMNEMATYLSSQNMRAKKYYFYFAYCPKCAKKYGHNYVVAFAEV